MSEVKDRALIKMQRNISYDLMRISAAVLVVLLHIAATKSKTLEPSDFDWKVMNFYNCFTRCCVPLFFMLNGAFSLKKDIDIKKLYLKKILPLVAVYIVWSFLYVVDTLGIEKFMQTGLINILKMMVSGKYHLWFIPTLIGLYMLHPILRAIVGYKDGMYVKYYFVLFICAGIIKPTLLLFLTEEHSLYISLLKKIPVELVSYSGYVLLGYYLTNMHSKKYRPRNLLLAFIGICIVTAVLCQLYAEGKGEPIGILYSNTTVNSFLEAVVLFLFFRDLKGKYGRTTERIVAYLSPLTFGVYLLHPFVMEQLDTKLSLNALAFSPIISIPILTVLITLICLAVTFVMIKIPVAKKFWKF